MKLLNRRSIFRLLAGFPALFGFKPALSAAPVENVLSDALCTRAVEHAIALQAPAVVELQDFVYCGVPTIELIRETAAKGKFLYCIIMDEDEIQAFGEVSSAMQGSPDYQNVMRHYCGHFCGYFPSTDGPAWKSERVMEIARRRNWMHHNHGVGGDTLANFFEKCPPEFLAVTPEELAEIYPTVSRNELEYFAGNGGA
jgi:hypothetical protein